MPTLTLKINGIERQIDDIDPATPLLWVLRDHLDLVGTKYGCGRGLCGACTVHLNGVPIRACIMPAGTMAGQSITTIEGIALSETELHPVQESWIAHDVPQCGYCQSGQIMSAVALLKKNPDPSDADIDNAMSGNLCRCGTYKRVRAAIQSVVGQGGQS